MYAHKQSQNTTKSASFNLTQNRHYSPRVSWHQKLCNPTRPFSRQVRSFSGRISQIQPKLIIDRTDDKYEHEADRVADQVMRIPEPQAQEVTPVSGQTHTIQIQRTCPECKEEEEKDKLIQTKPLSDRITPLVQRQVDEEEKEEEILQSKGIHGKSSKASTHLQEQIQSMRGGQPLPESVRTFFEPRFGHDFSQVRVHTEQRAAEKAGAINAVAYTTGQDIVFGTGQYSPQTEGGQRLLAHELTHVVQQKRSIQLSIQRKGPRTDAFGKECPDTVVIGSIKPIAGFNKALFDKGIRTWLGIYSYMKVGPKKKYESCITEVLKVEENTCENKGRLADYKPCTPKKYCLSVGGTKNIPTDPNIFLDMHRSSRKFSLLEGSGKKTCKVTCLQRYGCGGKEIGRFYVTRTFKAATFKDGNKEVPVTLGSIKKVIAKRKK